MHYESIGGVAKLIQHVRSCWLSQLAWVPVERVHPPELFLNFSTTLYPTAINLMWPVLRRPEQHCHQFNLMWDVLRRHQRCHDAMDSAARGKLWCPTFCVQYMWGLRHEPSLLRLGFDSSQRVAERGGHRCSQHEPAKPSHSRQPL